MLRMLDTANYINLARIERKSSPEIYIKYIPISRDDIRQVSDTSDTVAPDPRNRSTFPTFYGTRFLTR